MARFCPLASSSKGNSTWLSAGSTAVLVDVGISYRALVTSLTAQNLSVDDLHAVFITHEHSDHIKGLRTLLKKTGLPVYASTGTLEYLCARDYIPPNTALFECLGSVTVGDLEAVAFPTPHDAVDPIGIRFNLPGRRSVAVTTDLGHITQTVRDHISGCDLVMLESNYDAQMLEVSNYPYFLKRRIKGSQGHLSNADCSEELVRLVQSGSTHFVLAHLSEQNNLPMLAYESTHTVLQSAGMLEDADYILKVAPAHFPRETIIL